MKYPTAAARQRAYRARLGPQGHPDGYVDPLRMEERKRRADQVKARHRVKFKATKSSIGNAISTWNGGAVDDEWDSLDA